MSTTVTYKGSTLTTVDNQTRTLLTSGKYMEDDITLTDVSGSGANLQAKSNIDPTTSSQTITADQGYDGLSSVQINAMPSGVAIPASSISGTGATASITAGGDVMLTKTVNNLPNITTPGYISSGTWGNTDITLYAPASSLGLPWQWIGMGVEKLSNCYSESTTLKAVGFDSWTASTTAGTLRNGQTGTAFTADMANYDYLIKWRCRWDAAYLTGATFTAMPVNGMMEIYQFICRRPSTLANVQSEAYDQNVSQLMFNLTYQEYWNTSGIHTMNWGNTYGVTFTNNTPTYSGGDSPTITPTCPSIGARCNNSYFNAARKPYIDSENSPVKIVGEVYRFSKSALLATYESMVTLAKNGL